MKKIRMTKLRLMVVIALGLLGFSAPASVSAQESAASEEPAYGSLEEKDAAETGGSARAADQKDGEIRFPINAYSIRGNTILAVEEIESVLRKFAGPESTQATVDGARDALERHYHQKGYVTVTVFVPQQEVTSGVISMQVIEGIVGRVDVLGNRIYSRQSILDRLPSVRSGEILYLPALVADLTRLNRNPNLSVIPALSPGKRIGETDVELKVEERDPLQASLEVNNHVSENDSSFTRASFSVAYNSLWRLQHSIAFQYQTAPDDLAKLQVLGLTYSLPSPFAADDTIIAFGFLSFTSAEVAHTFATEGAGNNFGLRYIFLLPVVANWAQTLSVGLDYKGYTDKYDFAESETISEQYIEYWPIDVMYNLSTGWDRGRLGLRAGVAVQPRFLVDALQFEDRRYAARGNYVIGKVGFEYSYVVNPFLDLMVEGEGRLADQALIPNEQFSIGGTRTVRGYYEGEGSGDNGWRVSLEMSTRIPYPSAGGEESAQVDEGASLNYQIVPYAFTEAAGAYMIDALEGEPTEALLWSGGIGLRFDAFERVSGDISVGVPLLESGNLGIGVPLIQVSVRAYY